MTQLVELLNNGAKKLHRRSWYYGTYIYRRPHPSNELMIVYPKKDNIQSIEYGYALNLDDLNATDWQVIDGGNQ